MTIQYSHSNSTTRAKLIALQDFIIPVTLAIILIIISFRNYLLFHTLAEFSAIIVAILMFVVAWHTFVFSHNHFLMSRGDLIAGSGRNE